MEGEKQEENETRQGGREAQNPSPGRRRGSWPRGAADPSWQESRRPGGSWQSWGWPGGPDPSCSELLAMS